MHCSIAYSYTAQAGELILVIRMGCAVEQLEYDHRLQAGNCLRSTKLFKIQVLNVKVKFTSGGFGRTALVALKNSEVCNLMVCGL